MITRLVPTAGTDPFVGDLAERLARLTRHGHDTYQLLRAAVDSRPVPDEHPSMAIWWRVLDRLPKDATPVTNSKHSQPKLSHQVARRRIPSIQPDRQPTPTQPGPSR
jgi:hypothetical protein